MVTTEMKIVRDVKKAIEQNNKFSGFYVLLTMIFVEIGWIREV